MKKRYWLFKSDPDTFGLTELQASPGRTTCWDGVRNYQARNLLRDEVKLGDEVLFYHSRVAPPAVVALASIVREAYPDPTQYEPRGKYHDPASTAAVPRWYAVDLRLERELPQPVTLPLMRETRSLSRMLLLRKGSRLSIQPVTHAEWRRILKLGGL